jgi:hypothetical protein
MKFSKHDLYLVFIFLACVSTSGCTKDSAKTCSLYVPAIEDVTTSATLQELQQGRALYIDQGAGCHNLYSPDDYSPGQSPSI